jgi:uncharacterized membrane protein YgdD (TMEM256/DUF423 family)
MDRSRLLLALCGASGFLAVAAGAFGAHGVTDPLAKSWLETGGHYQLIHTVAALACWLMSRQGIARAMLSAWLFLGGALIFSGSLYLMALGAPHVLGAVTPIGGLALLAGWASLAITALLDRDNPSAK